MLGGPGNDTLRGNDGQDDLRGAGGKDKLFGGANFDTCDGGPHPPGFPDSAAGCEVVTGIP